MNESIVTDPAAPPQPAADPQLYVGLDGIEVQFPEGFWDDPRHALIVRGRARRDWTIDNLALAIATNLRKVLAERRTASGLVGPDGRPL